jgi:hypothetical protein
MRDEKQKKRVRGSENTAVFVIVSEERRGDDWRKAVIVASSEKQPFQ